MGLPPLPLTGLAFLARHLPPRPDQEVSEEQDDAAHRDVDRLPLGHGHPQSRSWNVIRRLPVSVICTCRGPVASHG